MSKQKNSGKGKFQNAFTLVELLVVISIIALLLAVLVPSLGKAKKQARLVMDKSNLKQWGLGFCMYLDENNGYFFSGQLKNSWTEGADYGRYWRVIMMPYLNDPKIWLCPEAIRPPNNGGMPAEGDSPSMAWEWLGNVGSYGLNGWVLNPPSGSTAVYSRAPVSNFWKGRQSGSMMSNIPVFADMWFTDAWPKETDTPSADAPAGRGETCPGDTPKTFCQKEMQRVCVNRHNGFVNVAFMDGSVRKVGLKELWTLKWSKSFNTHGRWTTAGGCPANAWPTWMRKYKDY